MKLFEDKLTHKQLVDIAYRWCCKNAECGVVFKELVTISSEIPDVIGFGSFTHSVLIECKASRADFLADKKKPFRITGRGMGKFRIYCAPKGMLKTEELPEKWGLLEVDEKGKAVCVLNPLKKRDEQYMHTMTHEVNEVSERAVLYSALRRLFIRGFVKEIYNERPEETINQ